MLATHNSCTFKVATNKLYELFHCIWRCQDKSLTEQYRSGVRFFDIRIYRKKNSWGFCHGKVNLYNGISDLFALYQVIRLQYPDAKYRIVLEKYKDNSEIELFKEEIEKYLELFKDRVYQCIIKPGWIVVWNNNKMNYNIVDNSWVPFTSDKPWYKQLSWKIFSTPKKWAKKHNHITQEEMDNESTIYFYDFI